MSAMLRSSLHFHGWTVGLPRVCPALRMSLVVLLACAGAGRGAGVLENGDFSNGLAGWKATGAAACFCATQGPDRIGPALLYRHEAARSDSATHLDQVVTLEPGATYVLSCRGRNDGSHLRPALRIAGMNWQTIFSLELPAEAGWKEASGFFSTRGESQVRVQVFGAGRDNRDAGQAGCAWFASVVLRKATADELRRQRAAVVRVMPGETVVPVSPLFFGVNALFWIENDASRADGRLGNLLRDMRCPLMRFPGGEVADNYHWASNRLDNIRDFPFADGPPTLDPDEFWAWKTAIGAEAIFVVNLESGYLHGRPDEGVAEAVAWVRDCRAKGRRVRYWEIGNETYLAATRHPLGAREYAAAVVKFSRAMKAADPSILIGATGPETPEATATIDAVVPDPAGGAAPAGHAGRKAAAAEMKALPRKANPEPWWPTLCREAKGAFDFAVVHRYDGSRHAFDRDACAPLKLKEGVRALRAYFARTLGAEIPIALTEWNVSPKVQLDRMEHALTIAEQIGNYLEGGVAMGCYWPMRYHSRSAETGFRSMIDYATNEPRAPYFVMKEFSLHGRGAVVRSECPQGPLYVVATRDGAAATVFLVNRSFDPGGVETTVEMAGAAFVDARSLVGDAHSPAGARMIPLAVTAGAGGRFACTLPSGSFSVLRFTLGGGAGRIPPAGP